MRKFVLVLIALLIGAGTIQAQNLSWRKHRKLAEEYAEKGEHALAAENFEKAWLKKKKKEELIFKAAESYYLIKDFRKAAECYQYVKNDNDDYPLVGLKYARSLKQDGQYDKAKLQFQRFLSGYTGEGKTILEDIIRVEIEGCELAKTLPEQARRDVEVIYPEGNINTEADEFGASPGENNELFFTSDRGNRARIYSSFQQGNLWTRASIPSNFPVIREGHYGNGSMASDGNRFYFTICNDDEAYSDLNSRCELFVIRRNGTGWGAPERLPEYINIEKVTNTHPAVAQMNGREYVFFASNREGARGGMDIYYVSRDLSRDDLEFTFPANAGPTVNTLGDEITPHYDAEERILYFASNGHVTIGGFDIFSATGSEQNWSTPENMGLPFNSGADDFGFVENQARTGGLFVSNRVFGGQKTSTRHTDIFEFTIEGRGLTVRGNVYDRATGSTIDNMEVYLFELQSNGSRKLVKQRSFTDGSYAFEVMAGRRYEVEVVVDGFENSAFQFATTDSDTPTYGQPVFLMQGTAATPDMNTSPTEVEQPPVTTPPQESASELETEEPTTPTPVAVEPTETFDNDPLENTTEEEPETISLPIEDAPATTPPTVETVEPPATTTEETTYVARPKSAKDKYEYASEAPRLEGTYFKIQLAAVSKYKPDNPKFGQVSDLGRFDTEEILERNLTRVLLADFFTIDEAKSALRSVKANGFPKAYIVRYEDGTRVGRER